MSATSTMSRDQFRMYRMGEECAFAADGSLVRFGDELTIAGRHPTFTVDRRHPEVDVHLDITATDTVTHFVRLGPIYRHWRPPCRNAAAQAAA